MLGAVAYAQGGRPLSIRELASVAGMYPSTAQRHVNHLVASGRLHRNPGQARSLTVAW